MNLIEELQARGLVKDCTDLDGLKEHLETPRHIYAGFDPTADSLTIGNLIPLIVLKLAQNHGHTPVVLMGEATAQIGDPSGKDSERDTLFPFEINDNSEKMQNSIINVLGDSAVIMSNTDFNIDTHLMDFMTGIARHVSVNEMIKKTSVKNRLETPDQGISLCEFMYSVFQAKDFLDLNNAWDNPVTVQIGGSDQWGNIVAGVDLIRKIAPDNKAFGLTIPLIEKSDGGKFGKTENGSIWLNADRTTPFDFFQFWMNISDEDAVKWAPMFLADRSVEAINKLIRLAADVPKSRLIQKTLAFWITKLIHGTDLAVACSHQSDIMFGNTDINDMRRQDFIDLLAIMPSITLDKDDGEEVNRSLLACLKHHGLIDSMRIGRELLASGCIEVNMEKIDTDSPMPFYRRRHGEFTMVKFGKRKWVLIRWF